MIKLVPFTSFPSDLESKLLVHAAKEFSLFDEELLKKSTLSRAIYVGDNCIGHAGIIRFALLSPPLLWLLLNSSVDRWHARELCKVIKAISPMFPHLQTVVEVGYTAGHRFASVCGFVPLEKFTTIHGRSFQFYEVNNG
jgi:hypothetical protein